MLLKTVCVYVDSDLVYKYGRYSNAIPFDKIEIILEENEYNDDNKLVRTSKTYAITHNVIDFEVQSE